MAGWVLDELDAPTVPSCTSLAKDPNSRSHETVPTSKVRFCDVCPQSPILKTTCDVAQYSHKAFMEGVWKNKLEAGCSMQKPTPILCAILQKIAQPKFNWFPDRTNALSTLPGVVWSASTKHECKQEWGKGRVKILLDALRGLLCKWGPSGKLKTIGALLRLRQSPPSQPNLTNAGVVPIAQPPLPSGFEADLCEDPLDIQIHDEHWGPRKASPPATTRRRQMIRRAMPAATFMSIWAPYATSNAIPRRPASKHHLEILANPAHTSMKSQFRNTTSLCGKTARISCGIKSNTSAGTAHANSFKFSSNCVVGSTVHSANGAVSSLRVSQR